MDYLSVTRTAVAAATYEVCGGATYAKFVVNDTELILEHVSKFVPWKSRTTLLRIRKGDQ